MHNAEIQALVESFTNQLALLVRRTALEQVVSALGGDAPAPARRGPGRPKGTPKMPQARRAARGGKRIRRSDADVAKVGEALLAHVTAHPGQRGEQIAAALGTDVGTMRLPMKALIAAKKVRTEGQRRGMTYFAKGASAPAEKSAAKTTKAKRGSKKKAG